MTQSPLVMSCSPLSSQLPASRSFPFSRKQALACSPISKRAFTLPKGHSGCHPTQLPNPVRAAQDFPCHLFLSDSLCALLLIQRSLLDLDCFKARNGAPFVRSNGLLCVQIPFSFLQLSVPLTGHYSPRARRWLQWAGHTEPKDS